MRYIVVLAFVVFFTSCKHDLNKESSKTVEAPREILIYCENVMVPPLIELKDKFEAEWKCKVKLHNDCSQNLASLIQYSLEGDIFLPASRRSFRKLSNASKAFIVDSVFLGYNPLVVMTQKGNPLKYSGNVKDLVNRKYAVIIANPETSSLGNETKKLLSAINLYDDVLLNIVALSTDSRGLVKSLTNGEAQLVINWESDKLNNGNINKVDIFPIPGSDNYPTEIYAGILSTSKHIDLARKFLNYATGKEGAEVFRKYGFSRRKSFIF